MAIPILVPSNPLSPTLQAQNKNLITYNGLSINDPSDDPNDTFLLEDAIESVTYNQPYEPLPDRDGISVMEPRNMTRIIQLRGWVRAPSLSKLYDKIALINAAFDPTLAYNADVLAGSEFDIGYLPMNFNVPTLDTANYATGLIPQRLYVQALSLPVSMHTKFVGRDARIDFRLRACDPRYYLQTEDTESLATAGVGATLNLDNTLAAYPSWPVITVNNAGGAVASGIASITRTSPSAYGTPAINLARSKMDAAAHTYIIDAAHRTLSNPSGASDIQILMGTSTFFQIMPGVVNTVVFSFFPATFNNWSISWRRAFV